jgi:hypothetical protein
VQPREPGVADHVVAAVEEDEAHGPEVRAKRTTGLTADQLVARRDKASPAFDAAANFLDSLSADEGVVISAAELNSAADQAGISAETLRRAKKDRGWVYDPSTRAWRSPGAESHPGEDDAQLATHHPDAQANGALGIPDAGIAMKSSEDSREVAEVRASGA